MNQAVPPSTASRRHWLIACALLPWLATARAEPGAQIKPWSPSRKTPALQLKDTSGAAWTLASTRGHPVLLNLWATWCAPCREEMPSLQALAQRHEAEGLRVLAINHKEGEAAVRRFMASTGLELPVLLDPAGAAAKTFDVHIYPSTIGIDRRGRVKFVVTGEVDWSGAEAARWVAQLM